MAPARLLRLRASLRAPWWYYRPYYYDYPPRIVEEPPIYIGREPSGAPPPGYWYYCASADAYYPKVETCAEPWVKVPPRAEEGER